MEFRRHDSMLLLASVATVASFVAATIYTQRQLVRLDSLSTAIQTNAVPSVEFLAKGIASLTRLRELLENSGRGGGYPTPDAARQELNTFDNGIEQYLRLTPLPGEENLWRRLRWDVDRTRAAAGVALATLEAGQRQQFDAALNTAFYPAFDHTIALMWDAFRFDIRQSERLAQEVRELRTSTRNTVAVLNVLATLVAVVGAVVAFRASRHHDRLVETHRAMLADRVTELDRFAGRVAHDILSPLGTIAFSLQVLTKVCDGQCSVHVERAERGLDRVQQLVDGLLTFARSGARSRGEARCSVDAVLENVAGDCAEMAHAAGVTLSMPPPTGLQVACSLGVGTSILENLVRNAIKYMGDRPLRRVDVRIEPRGHLVRIEVADTGPGIPDSIHSTLFEPFVRGHDEGSGIGLGLATVKRLVEGHGGAIAIQSQVNAGSVFYIDLPSAGSVQERCASKPAPLA